MSDKLAIVVAPTGALNSRDRTPFMPYTVEEQADEAKRCENAGAPIYHVHVRDKKGANSGDPIIYGELVTSVRKKSSALIQIGGALGPRRDPDTGLISYPFTEDDRLAALKTKPAPDLFTVKIGAVELQVPGEQYETVGLRNSPSFLRKAIPYLIENKLCVELEIFDVGCLYNAKKLEAEGLFGSRGLSSPGFYLHYVMGHGGQPASMKQLMYIFEEGKKLFPDAEVCVSAAADDCYTIITTALLLGCNMVRCGIEDSHKLSNGRMATSNVEIVENVVRIAEEIGRNIASVEDAKKMLMPE
jgi:3-keto-5-aminohexanoate cleavage enzyme